MTSISGAVGALSALGSYFTSQSSTTGPISTSVGATGTDLGQLSSEVGALVSTVDGFASGGATSDPLSNLLGLPSPDPAANSGSGSLSDLLGSTFADTNSLLSQVSSLAAGSPSTGNATTASGGSGPTQAQQIASLLGQAFQTEQQDFINLLI